MFEISTWTLVANLHEKRKLASHHKHTLALWKLQFRLEEVTLYPHLKRLACCSRSLTARFLWGADRQWAPKVPQRLFVTFRFLTPEQKMLQWYIHLWRVSIIKWYAMIWYDKVSKQCIFQGSQWILQQDNFTNSVWRSYSDEQHPEEVAVTQPLDNKIYGVQNAEYQR